MSNILIYIDDLAPLTKNYVSVVYHLLIDNSRLDQSLNMLTCTVLYWSTVNSINLVFTWTLRIILSSIIFTLLKLLTGIGQPTFCGRPHTFCIQIILLWTEASPGKPLFTMVRCLSIARSTPYNTEIFLYKRCSYFYNNNGDQRVYFNLKSS